MAKDTAESKLLKLIEEADAKDGKGAPAAAAVSADASKVLNSVSSVGVAALPVPPLVQKIMGLFAGGPRTSAGFGLRFVNIILLLVIVIVGTVFFIDFSNGMQESQRSVSFEVKQKTFDAKDEALPAAKDVVEYVTAISPRNIFRPFEKKVEEAKVVAPAENQQIKDKLTNFKLVGISWLNTPETATVMIEDKGRGVTLFKKTGEELEGVKVDVIYADRVEFSFQGQKLTMNL